MTGVSQVSPDSQESQGSLDLRGRWEKEERRAAMDLQDQVVQKESEVLQECQVFQEHRESRVCRVTTDLQARGEWQDATEQRVNGVSQEVAASQDSRA